MTGSTGRTVHEAAMVRGNGRIAMLTLMSTDIVTTEMFITDLAVQPTHTHTHTHTHIGTNWTKYSKRS